MDERDEKISVEEPDAQETEAAEESEPTSEAEVAKPIEEDETPTEESLPDQAKTDTQEPKDEATSDAAPAKSKKKIIAIVAAVAVVVIVGVILALTFLSPSAKFDKFADYIRGEGGVTISDNSGSFPTTVEITCSENGTIHLKYRSPAQISNVGGKWDYETSFAYGDEEIKLTGTTTTWSGVLNNATYSDDAVINIKELKPGWNDGLSWTNHSFLGSEKLRGFIDYKNPNSVISPMTKALNQALTDSGLGITMQDLGFENYVEKTEDTSKSQ